MSKYVFIFQIPTKNISLKKWVVLLLLLLLLHFQVTLVTVLQV